MVPSWERGEKSSREEEEASRVRYGDGGIFRLLESPLDWIGSEMASFAAAVSLSSRFSGDFPSLAKFRLRSAAASAWIVRSPIVKRRAIRCEASALDSAAVFEKSVIQAKEFKKGMWEWKFGGESVNVYYEEHGEGEEGNSSTIVLIPTISDVSTVEEWRAVARNVVARPGETNWRAVIVDWPGLGFSDRPSINYDADVMEDFLVSFLAAKNGPLSNSGKDPVIIGGGHAATIAVRAAKKGLIKSSAIAAVAPTWAGPLPIVFGRSSDMESRYGLLRGTLRAPAVGWMVYNALVSNEKAIQSQYTSHVYSDANNVTPEMVKSRYELTKRKGARYVPAAFLTGELDPVDSREEFLAIFAGLQVPVLVVGAAGAPRRSKAEMDALNGVCGVSKFVEVPGALLPQEEYPDAVAEEIFLFLDEVFSSP